MAFKLDTAKTGEKLGTLLRLLDTDPLRGLVAYLEAVTSVTPGQLRASVAAIFSNHAQHLMVLWMELGLPPIPSPFASGQE